jgi:hypothetical protein
MQRVVASLLALVWVAGSLAAAADCAGWQPTAAARMACCLNASDRCPDQLSADACCARSEQAHLPTATVMFGTDSAPRVPLPVGLTSLSPLPLAYSDTSLVLAAPAPPRPPGSPPVPHGVLRI